MAQCKGKTRRAVVPFIINITMEINFSSKVYSKSLTESWVIKQIDSILLDIGLPVLCMRNAH